VAVARVRWRMVIRLVMIRGIIVFRFYRHVLTAGLRITRQTVWRSKGGSVVDRGVGRVHLCGLNGEQTRRTSLGSQVRRVGHAYERIRLAENGGLEVELDPDGVFGI